jgi:hypothetical protein
MRAHSQVLLASGIPVFRRNISFYFSHAERSRFLSLLTPAGSPTGLVLACTRDDLSYYSAALATRPSGAALTRVEITADWHRSAAAILEAAYRELRLHGSVRLLADFTAKVPQHAIHELESILVSGTRNLDIVSVTQYDGRTLTSGIHVDRFRALGQVVFGPFYTGPLSAHSGVRSPALADSSKDVADSAA